MKKLFYDFLNDIDAGDLIRRTEELCKFEAGQTFRAYHEAADHVLRKLLRKCGETRENAA